MDDLISRQAAIDALNDEYHGMISDESMKIYQIIKWLDELPSAQKEQLWIPCSERLPIPEGREPYLVTVAHYDPEYKGRFVEIDYYDARDPYGCPIWENHHENDGIRVVAWMPLPEPYNNGGNE